MSCVSSSTASGVQEAVQMRIPVRKTKHIFLILSILVCGHAGGRPVVKSDFCKRFCGGKQQFSAIPR
jgi:hypothetical protein